MSSATLIYALCEPGTRTVRYIGKANNPAKRLKEHWWTSRKRKNHLGNWLRALEERPALVILSEIPHCEWEAEERRFIRAARMLGMPLVNATEGGEGGQKGKTHSEDSKSKMSRAGKAFWKAHPEIGFLALKAALKAATIANTGRRRSASERAKRLEKVKAAWVIRKAGGSSSSKFPGVCWDKQRHKWLAFSTHNGKYAYIGRFKSEVEAALAREARDIELFGEKFAQPNFKSA